MLFCTPAESSDVEKGDIKAALNGFLLHVGAAQRGDDEVEDLASLTFEETLERARAWDDRAKRTSGAQRTTPELDEFILIEMRNKEFVFLCVSSDHDDVNERPVILEERMDLDRIIESHHVNLFVRHCPLPQLEGFLTSNVGRVTFVVRGHPIPQQLARAFDASRSSRLSQLSQPFRHFHQPTNTSILQATTAARWTPTSTSYPKSFAVTSSATTTILPVSC